MYFKMLVNSLVRRRSRMAVALLAVAIGSAVLLGLTTICYDIPRQMMREFRSYGANMVLVPSGEDAELKLSDVEKAANLLSRENLVGITPYRYEIVRSNMQPYTAVGTRFEEVKKTSPYWRIEGGWPAQDDEILIGSEIAETTRLIPGKTIPIIGRNAKGARYSREMKITGIVKTGSVEDGFIFMDLSAMENMVGTSGIAEVAEVSIATTSSELSALVSSIQENVPSITPRLVKRVANSETSVLSKLQALVYLVTLVILALTMICVATTMMTVIMERRKEIGLKKALGAENRNILAEFLGEGVFLGLLGGILGTIFGGLFAQMISMNVFGRSISFNPHLAFAAVGLSIIVTGAACLIPVRRVTDIEPAVVLRGE